MSNIKNKEKNKYGKDKKKIDVTIEEILMRHKKLFIEKKKKKKKKKSFLSLIWEDKS